MRSWAKGLLLGAATGLTGAAFGLTSLGGDFEKNVGLPWLFSVRGPIEAPKDVAVVAIDQGTGKQLDLPALPRDWPRSIHARLVENLVSRGASVIVFDMDFQRPKAPEDDLALARALARAQRVVLVVNLSGRRQPIVDAQGRQIGMTWVEQPNPPIAPLAEAAKAMAPFPVPKVQVAIHDYWAFKSSAGDAPTMPAVALQVNGLRLYDRWIDLLRRAGAPGVRDLPRGAPAAFSPSDVERLMLRFRLEFRNDPGLAERVTTLLAQTPAAELGANDKRLLLALVGLYAGDDNRYLNFYGPPGSIATIPYHLAAATTVGFGGAPTPDLKDKVVFVGFSDLYDPGQPDRFYTVFTREDGVDLSGVEIAATAYANLLNRQGVHAADPETGALILLAFGSILAFGTFILPALVGVPAALALGAGYGAAAQHAFATANLWLPLATPVLLQLPAALFLGLVGQYLLERRKKMRVTQTMRYYLPESVAKELEKGFDPTALNKVVRGTCLATDMAGFTSISERLGPEELASFMNAYFEALAAPLKRHQVDVTEFHADTIMCAWLAPENGVAARRRSVLAALEVVKVVGDFGRSRSMNSFAARIGLENGAFYLGHAGGGGRLAYSILGDCANTASRLEGLNKHLGTQLLATDTAVAGLDDDLLLRPVGVFRFVGKSETRPIFEIVTPKETASEAQIELCRSFAEALDTFHAERWSVAARLFETHLARHGADGPAKFFLELCRRYESDPRPEQPSVIRMDTK